MPPSSISFNALCLVCNTKVTTLPALGRPKLIKALEQDAEVRVACFPADHQWSLTQEDKANLAKAIAEGVWG